MAGRLGGARDVAYGLWVVEQEVELGATGERLETDFRLRPAERTLDAAEVELERRGHARSKIVAMPCPKPMHMVSTMPRPFGRRPAPTRLLAGRSSAYGLPRRLVREVNMAKTRWFFEPGHTAAEFRV